MTAITGRATGRAATALARERRTSSNGMYQTTRIGTYMHYGKPPLGACARFSNDRGGASGSTLLHM